MTADPRPEISSSEREARQWAMILHLSLLAGFLVPLAGLIVPIVVWQMKREQFPELDVHAHVILNWILSALLYAVIGFVLSFVLIGFAVLFALSVAAVVFPIVGGIKASDGQVWPYPLSIRFFK